jgi:hypothetical protein
LLVGASRNRGATNKQGKGLSFDGSREADYALRLPFCLTKEQAERENEYAIKSEVRRESDYVSPNIHHPSQTIRLRLVTLSENGGSKQSRRRSQ